MSLMNRLGNTKNQFQGPFKRVLCVCSAGVLRSPTAAFVLSNSPYDFNTRAAGVISEFALILVDSVLMAWADEIVCMEAEQKEILLDRFKIEKPIIVLGISDSYEYRNKELMTLIALKYGELTG